jgi:hypothetical protein
MDFGAAAAKYVDAFFQNIRWETVLARRDRASKMAPCDEHEDLCNLARCRIVRAHAFAGDGNG